MPIRTLLERCAFAPEDAQRIAAAYEDALRSLGLVDRNDPICEIVARKIIQIARAGTTDPAEICRRVVRELGVSPQP